MSRVDLRSDTGSVAPLILGFVAILVGLLGVITDSSAAFLARRSLVASADGAALYAAGALDRDRLYDEDLEFLPIARSQAVARAGTYVSRTDLRARYRRVTITAVTLDRSGTRVTVTLSAGARLPFSGWLTGGHRTVTLTATASARAPLS